MAGRGGLIGHVENPLRQGNAQAAQDCGQRCSPLGTLHQGLPVPAVAHHLQLVQGMANRPPRLLATALSRPFQPQRPHTELPMGDDPMRTPMGERPALQPGGLHPPETAFDQHQAGRPQRDSRGGAGLVVGRHHARALLLRGRRHLRGSETEAAARIQPQVASEAA
jgi:hypothetical protein